MVEKTDASASKPSKVGRGELDLLVASVFIKVLLFPAYRSTDFEVHRNWLAVTRLPLKQWYFESTSEWTLDYPPFFAYFERGLSNLALLVDPEITRISKEAIATWPTIAFQRTSVIASELVLLYALYKYIRPAEPSTRVIAASLFLHPGLIFIDHIHFQYNGMLLGLLLLSLVQARQGNLPASAFFFAVLLNFKHIFVYLAPPYLVYLLRAYCYGSTGHFQAHRFVLLALVGVAVCAVSFGPFFAAGGFSQIQQIVSRLFPFQRGLNHAYWAGNVWALYTAADRVLVKYLLIRGLPVSEAAVNSSSRGLVGDVAFGVLPEPKAIHCLLLTVGFNVLYTVKLWRKPTYKNFVRAVTLSAFTSFLFGFHVHEKAILLVLFPLSLVAVEDHAHYRVFLLTSSSGIVALFPLLIHPMEAPVKLLYAATWFAIVMPLLSRAVHRPSPTSTDLLVYYAESLYIFGFPVLQAFVSMLHPWLFRTSQLPRGDSNIDSLNTPSPTTHLEFLPLMLTSVYCACGLVWAWAKLSRVYLRG